MSGDQPAAAGQKGIVDRGDNRAWARPLALPIALALMALALVLIGWRMQPPAARTTNAPRGEFSAGRADAILGELLAEGVPHPAGSASNYRVRDRIVAYLTPLGYDVQIQDVSACREMAGSMLNCAPAQNILARLPGQSSGPGVMLATHYDSAGAGPGASDTTASVAALIEIARILKEQAPLRNPVLLLITDAEEAGSLGAQGFVNDHPWAKEIGAVINLEARGTAGQSLMFETSRNSGWLARVYASSVRRPATNSLMVEAYRALPSDTDLTIFMKAGLPGLNLAFTDEFARYHTPLDNLANLDLRSLQHQGETALALARTLAGMDLASPPAGDLAYTDILGWGVIRWPASWSLPIAISLAIVLLGAALFLVWQRTLSLRELLWGFLAALLGLLLSLLLNVLLMALIGTAASAPEPWYAYPQPTRLALWAAALLGPGAIGAWLARRAGLWGLGLGVWLFWAVLAIVASLAMPGSAILLLVPALSAALLVVLAALVPLPRPLAGEIAFLVPALVAAITWLPSALHVESVSGFDLSPAITLIVTVVGSTLLPFLALPPGRTAPRRWLLTAAALLAVGGPVAALFVPPYSDAHPQPIDVYHFEDRDTGAAHFVALAPTEEVRAPLRALLDGTPLAVFPWTSYPFLVAQASPTGEPAPDLEIVSDKPREGGGRVVTIRLRSARSPREFDLRIPIALLLSVTAGGQTFTPVPEQAPTGEVSPWYEYYHLFCFGPACDGFQVALEFKTGDPVEALVTDRTSGLPPGADALLQARGRQGTPIHEGDETLILRRVEF